MDGWIQIHGWLASRPARFFKKKGCPIHISRPARQPAGWPANHVFESTHPFWGYNIGIGILLNVFSLLWGVFSLLSKLPP